MKRLIAAVAVALASTTAAAQGVEPSFKDYVTLSAEDLAPRAGARSSAEILAEFPQPSFRDAAPVRTGRAVRLAASGN